MKQRYLDFLNSIDSGRMMSQTERLWRAELGQTTPCHQRAADLTLELLRENGLPNAEKITLAADGKSVWQDKIAPLGWDATIGKLTVLSGPGIDSPFVAADFQQHPFHLVQGSCATTPGGETLRLITFEQMLAGQDPTDAMVMIQENAGPGCPDLQHFMDLGARGIVTDYAMNAEDEPDGIQWNNAFTERADWHCHAGERPFLAFAVTPRMGRRLRQAAVRGEVKVHVESDGRRYETTVDLVTALLPGRRQEEFWILAHLYEPLSNDNSSGVVAAMEMLRQLQARGVPEFSVRVIFGLEMYGFASYAMLRGDKNLSAEVIGAIDVDAMYLRDDWSLKLRCAAPASPFYGNYLLRMLQEDLQGTPGVPEMTFLSSFPCMYDDDSFLGDSTIGVPVLWPIRYGKDARWHNSRQIMDYLHPRAYAVGTAIDLTLVDAIVNPRQDLLSRVARLAAEELAEERQRAVGSLREHLEYRCRVLRQDFENFARALPSAALESPRRELEKVCAAALAGAGGEPPRSPWREFADRITPRRIRTGFPFDCALAPVAERVKLPGSVLYSPMAAILSDMDGKRTLAEILRTVEHEICRILPERELRKYIHTVLYLAEHGYVALDNIPSLEKDDIVRALREAGVRQGDFLLVHSALGALGHITGGAATVVEALKEAVGQDGTFLCAVLGFAFPYIGGPNANRLYRPFDKDDARSIWTGALPRFLLEHGYTRSRHYTHRWTGWGRDAEAACRDHEPADAPMAERSPIGYALHHGGKIIHLGSQVSSTTFLHLIEDRMDLPGVEDVLIKEKLPNGGFAVHAVPRNLPGCREFYHGDEENIRFFQEARSAGLRICRAKLGLGDVRAMDMSELYRIGGLLAAKDPFIFLHDESAGCLSCNRLRRNWRATHPQ
ncbi:MAG: AAC(3) family N-acetyltransferase [Victivallales bacterium]|nr:AAC(3) family N-acetyltransferase [Victivallales bacterium]